MEAPDSVYLNAQWSVLGAALIEPKLVGRLLFELSPDCFDGENRTLFNLLDSMFADGKPMDIITIANEMGGDEKTVAYLKGLMDTTPTLAHFDDHIRIVREKFRLRRLRELGRDLAAADNAKDVEDLIAQANMLMVSDARNRGHSLAELLSDFSRRMETKPEHLPWPIAGMENLVRVRPGHYILICAEPSAGKTAFALQCAVGWAEKHRVGFFSLEMGNEDITDRIVARAAAIPYDNIQDHNLNNYHWEQFSENADWLSTRNMRIYDAPGYTVQDIKAVTLADRLEIVIVDYGQLIEGPGGSEYEIQTRISKALRQMALSTKTVVVALAQVRKASGHDGEKLTMRDIKGTGQWEQDADLVLMLSPMEPHNSFAPRYLETAKNRNGRPGYAYLNFIGNTQNFVKMPESEAKKWLADRKADKKAEKEGVYKNERFC